MATPFTTSCLGGRCQRLVHDVYSGRRRGAGTSGSPNLVAPLALGGVLHLPVGCPFRSEDPRSGLGGRSSETSRSICSKGPRELSPESFLTPKRTCGAGMLAHLLSGCAHRSRPTSRPSTWMCRRRMCCSTSSTPTAAAASPSRSGRRHVVIVVVIAVIVVRRRPSSSSLVIVPRRRPRRRRCSVCFVILPLGRFSGLGRLSGLCRHFGASPFGVAGVGLDVPGG